MDLSPRSPSDQIADEGRTTAGAGTVDECADRPAETQQDIDLQGGLSTPVSDGAPQSSPASTPSADKPTPKSAFVKIMELDKEDMLMAWLEAFFGESP